MDMCLIDLFKLGVSEEARLFLAIVLDVGVDVALNGAIGHFVQETLAEGGEEGVEALVELEAHFQGDLGEDGFVLAVEVLVAFELLQLFLVQAQ